MQKKRSDGFACSRPGRPVVVSCAERERPARPSYTAEGSGLETPWLKLQIETQNETSLLQRLGCVCFFKHASLFFFTCNDLEHFGFNVFKLQNRLQHRLHFRVIQLCTSFKFIQQQQCVRGVWWEASCKKWGEFSFMSNPKRTEKIITLYIL